VVDIPCPSGGNSRNPIISICMPTAIRIREFIKYANCIIMVLPMNGDQPEPPTIIIR